MALFFCLLRSEAFRAFLSHSVRNEVVSCPSHFDCMPLIRYPNSFRIFVRRLHSTSPIMVEGHSVHRVAFSHSQRLVGKRFSASSPNGRFTDGAKAIDGKLFHRIEAVGKNLFAFFGEPGSVAMVCVHVHFGMSGAWSVFDRNIEEVPEVSVGLTYGRSERRLCAQFLWSVWSIY